MRGNSQVTGEFSAQMDSNADFFHFDNAIMVIVFNAPFGLYIETPSQYNQHSPNHIDTYSCLLRGDRGSF